MKKRFILLATLLITGFLPVTKTSAQTDTTTTKQYTLQQCLDYALKNYNDIKNAELDIQSAAARVGEVKGAGLPKLAGKASITDNPDLPRSYFDGGNPFAAALIPGAQAGTVYGVPNSFQVRSSGDVSVTLSQLLFDGSYIMGLKASAVYKELASKSLTQTKINVVENVTKAFYLVLINNERLALLNANVSRIDSLLKNTRGLQKEGFAEQLDADRIEVTRNNLLAELTKFNQLNEVTALLLKYQMGMPLTDSLSLTGDVKDIQVEAIDKNAVVNPKSRIEYSLLETQLEFQRLTLQSDKAKFFPSLSGFATGGYNRSDNTVPKLFNDTWYKYSMWGLNLSVPIIDGGSKIYKVKQSRYAYQKAENNLNFFAQTVDLQAKQSMATLNNEIENLKIQRRNLELATKVVRVAKIKYTSGTASNIEVIEAENAFKESQTNFYNAVYNTLLAKISYQKSTGTLYTE
ncbi:MAG: outer membrane protein [Chitinophagaceae bacterium]|nr:outer membrane protein [Chitinophagaceae bacterium]